MSLNMRKQDGLKQNESGMVAITIALVVMIIVTLIISSFVLIVNREQRNVLDRQLSSQAFYAAESGLEDARLALTSPRFGNILTEDITECTAPDGTNAFVKKMRDEKGVEYDNNIYSNVSYSCLLIDRTPKSLTYTINPNQGGILVPVSADTIDKIRISWQNQTGVLPTENSSSFDLPSGGGSLSAPMLRVTILPGFGGGALSSHRLINEAHTVFLYPNATSDATEVIGYLGLDGGPNSTNDNQGKFVSGNCKTTNTPRHCVVEINNLVNDTPLGVNEEYFLAIQPLYKSAEIEIEGLDSLDVTQELYDAQALIDVTGKAEDVLRRIQARLPISNGAQLKGISGFLPGAALETSKEICKLLEYDGASAQDNCALTP